MINVTAWYPAPSYKQQALTSNYLLDLNNKRAVLCTRERGEGDVLDWDACDAANVTARKVRVTDFEHCLHQQKNVWTLDLNQVTNYLHRWCRSRELVCYIMFAHRAELGVVEQPLRTTALVELMLARQLYLHLPILILTLAYYTYSAHDNFMH